ncbi:hypothetical protein BJ741DRAFT_674829 [Chytriomyces cf. hyalinus JEL632]|nr:hypothetical protein BJ741DRAFT_674829 [Chytriomyces cf. hyalinus JEL632]
MGNDFLWELLFAAFGREESSILGHEGADAADAARAAIVSACGFEVVKLTMQFPIKYQSQTIGTLIILVANKDLNMLDLDRQILHDSICVGTLMAAAKHTDYQINMLLLKEMSIVLHCILLTNDQLDDTIYHDQQTVNITDMMTLFNDLADYHQVQNGTMNYEATPTDFVALMWETVGIFGSGVDLQVDANVPMTIHVDALCLQTMLTNIFLRLTDAGTVRINVSWSNGHIQI